MKTIKGPAIFLAQFAGDAAPFDSLASIARWAAGHGYKESRFRAGMHGCSTSRARPRARPIAMRCKAFSARPASR